MQETIENIQALYTWHIDQSFAVYMKKQQDYGTSWRWLRPRSVTDQIFIKAKRIVTILELKEQKVSDSVEDEFKGILNYCIMALIQLQHPDTSNLPYELSHEQAHGLYQEHAERIIKKTFQNPVHLHVQMQVSSYADLALAELFRVKMLEDKRKDPGMTEKIAEHYEQITNWAIFALLKLNEEQNS